ncbi:MAG: hypothetical protein SOI13_01525 [Bifidobacterium mongoliense]|jgi:hypothetical protein|uniref:hypothetical protein n=1 Tax=Bifidobacterium mongoliense TaxID=518643 RepID=UPI002F3580B9
MSRRKAGSWKLAAGVVVAVALAAGCGAGGYAAGHAEVASVRAETVEAWRDYDGEHGDVMTLVDALPACAHEDGAGQPGLCAWDPLVQGNGEGTRVLVYRDGVLLLDSQR